MHLFKNKTKDVKQFLQEMKANKTNRSSNANTLEKKHNKPPHTISPEPYHSEYRSNTIGHPRPQNFDNSSREHSSNFSNQASNSFRDSAISNSRSVHSIHSVGQKFVPVPPPSQQIPHQPQRMSQEQGFYKEKGQRPIHNDRTPYHQTERFTNFEPVSDPIYDEYTQSISSNRNPNLYDPIRSHVQYQKPIPQSFNPYQSEAQQGYYQNNRNFNEIPEERRTQNFKSNSSQHSNSPTYDQAEFYQNSNNMPPQSRLPQSRISQPKPSQIIKPTVNSSFVNHNAKPNINRATTQFDTRSSINENQKSNPYFKKNDAPRLYTSQMSEINQPMAQISEIDDCFSTQNDSPAKFTEFLSKTKYNFNEIEQIVDNEAMQGQKIIEIEERRDSKPFGKKEKPGKTPDFRRSINSSQSKLSPPQKKVLLPKKEVSPPQKQKFLLSKTESSPSLKDKVFSPPKKMVTENRMSSEIKTKQKVSQIKLSQNQKHRLEKSLHQVDQVHIKLDGILKETSIILNNIKRSDEEFRKMIKKNGLINGGHKRQGLRMEVEEQEMKMEKHEGATEKKAKPKMERNNENLMNEKQTYKKSRSNYEQVEI